MLKELLNKNATIFLKDGSILEGFISAVDEEYIKVIELSNEFVIQRINEISTVRTGIKTKEVKSENPLCFSVPAKRSVVEPGEYFQPTIEPDEFSMLNDVNDVGAYQKPSFVRKTKKDDLKK